MRLPYPSVTSYNNLEILCRLAPQKDILVFEKLGLESIFAQIQLVERI